MRLITLTLISIFIISCNKNNPDTYTFRGDALGFEDGNEILIYSMEDNQTTIIDTILVKGGKFSTELPNNDAPSLHYMVVNNSSVLFFPDNEDLTATIYKDSIASSYVSGNEQNAAYINFTKKMRAFNDQKMQHAEMFKKARTDQDNAAISNIQKGNRDIIIAEKDYQLQFAKENPNSYFALMLVNDMLNKKNITAQEALDIMDSFSPKITATPLANELKITVENQKNSEVGGIAPQFSAKTPDGKDLSLKDVLGKYTIIDFWASWCRPCRAENPNVVKVYEQYHDKGLNIISVSLDKEGQEDRWIKAIEDDKMNWYHVSNLKAWQDPIAKEYNVRSIPATFLLDENGKIIGKDLRGAALGQKIGSLLD